MFERLNTPEEAFNYKLGATLKMENKVLEILEENMEHAHDERVVQLLREHRSESEQHVAHVEDAFRTFGWEVEESACPTIEALEKEGKSLVKKSDDAIVDLIILEAAVEVEHHEIAVYENLIAAAEELGRQEVAQALRHNAESEQAALEKVKSLKSQLAAQVKQPV